jgi:hypothetical protein
MMMSAVEEKVIDRKDAALSDLSLLYALNLSSVVLDIDFSRFLYSNSALSCMDGDDLSDL